MKRMNDDSLPNYNPLEIITFPLSGEEFAAYGEEVKNEKDKGIIVVER